MRDTRVPAGELSAPEYFPFTLHGPRLIKSFHGATDSVRLCNREWTKVMKVSRSSNFDSEWDPDNLGLQIQTVRVIHGDSIPLQKQPFKCSVYVV